MCCLPFDRIEVRHPGIAASLCSNRLGVRFSRSIFGLQGRQRLTMHAGGLSLIFTSGLIIGTGYARETLLQHRASCRGAGPQYHQKLKELELYSVGNGLEK